MQNADLTEKRNIKPSIKSNFEAVDLNEKIGKLWIKIIFFKVYIEMEKISKFGDIEIQKQKFHKHEGPISIKKYRYY